MLNGPLFQVCHEDDDAGVVAAMWSSLDSICGLGLLRLAQWPMGARRTMPVLD
jgi:hypothetical protein